MFVVIKEFPWTLIWTLGVNLVAIGIAWGVVTTRQSYDEKIIDTKMDSDVANVWLKHIDERLDRIQLLLERHVSKEDLNGKHE
jgi:hypothetical protein